MSAASWAQFVVFVALVFAGAPVLGWYMAKVYGDQDDGGQKKAPGDRVFLPDRARHIPAVPHRCRTANSAGPPMHSR